MNDSVIYYRVYVTGSTGSYAASYVGQYRTIEEARYAAAQYKRGRVVEWNAASNVESEVVA